MDLRLSAAPLIWVMLALSLTSCVEEDLGVEDTRFSCTLDRECLETHLCLYDGDLGGRLCTRVELCADDTDCGSDECYPLPNRSLAVCAPRPFCEVGERRCDGQCTPLDTVDNCGACGVTCSEGAACVEGACEGCVTGTRTVWRDRDRDSWGDSNASTLICEGSPIPDGFVARDGDCNDGAEEANPSETNEICDGLDNNCDGNRDEGCDTCEPPDTRCGERCVDLESDVASCGSCGNACPVDSRCEGGTCLPGCASGFTLCGDDGCVDLERDTQHCGVCDNLCPANAVCSSGTCSAGCKSGEARCDGTCVDILSDPMNCGRCGTMCMGLNQSDATCQNGVCIPGSCDLGFLDCDAEPGTCETVEDDMNCGACGNVCGGINESGRCEAGICQSDCQPGWLDCDGLIGCETPSDTSNCGACGQICGLNQSGATCQDGTCAPGLCDTGFIDCDGDNTTCETPVGDDNCGGCGVNCGEGARCVDGGCETCLTPGETCADASQCCSGRCDGTCLEASACTVDTNCNDGLPCTDDRCDTSGGTPGICDNTPRDELCDDGLFCTGEEVCDTTEGCTRIVVLDCDDGVDCTTDTCDEFSDSCSNIPDNTICDDDLFCNGAEFCDASAGCRSPGPVSCGSDAFACTDQVCDEASDGCVTLTDDGRCNPGEYCDASTGCTELGCNDVTCNGELYACGDCVDNDGDGLKDSFDAGCLGPCDDDESVLAPVLPGQSSSSCERDCFFDDDTGSGDDRCYWSFQCDPQAPGPSCAYDPNVTLNSTDATCSELAAAQDTTCTSVCGPLVPNGCDCFGCCEIEGTFVQLALETTSTDVCTLDSLDDPAICPPCTPVQGCLNPCESCEVCVDGTFDSGSCGQQACPNSLQPCGQPGQPLCQTGEYCVSGCCVVLP